ncbi:MAG: HAMP domain-containing histidine kinase [Anaerolineales bacterium]|nr:HAMP domain-containing histidine kinase [Anaerolineales bacterium]
MEENNVVDDLNEIRKRHQELDELKNTFIALVSHELRTPVNLISGYLELGLEEIDQNALKAQGYFEKANESMLKLHRVVEELTDFARLQRGKAILQRDPMPIREALQNTYQLLKPELEKKSIGLHINIPKYIRDAQFDADSLLICFRNILSNAAKFSPEGSPVHVKGERTNDQLIILIQDRSKPIPEDKRETIFEDFRQLENYLTRRYEGMGLGLAVARRTARMLGGDISLEVREDGNTFMIILPAEADHPNR